VLLSHLFCCSEIAKYITLKAESSVGNEPLDLVFLFIVAFKDSIGFVV
jgi:hypothetical protein